MNNPLGSTPDPWEDPNQGIRGGPPPDPWESPAAPSAGPAPASEYVQCWRCGKLGLKGLKHCIYCRAILSREEPWEYQERPRKNSTAPLTKVVLVFLGLLITLMVFFSIQIQEGGGIQQEDLRRALLQMLIFGVIQAGLILLAWAWVGRPPALARPSLAVRTAGWASAAPLLVLALGLAYGYSRLIQNYVGLPFKEPDFTSSKGLLALAVLVICVEPALVEELFFRYLALNTLRPVTGLHSAVVISSVMFGMAHIGNPLGIPLLMVIGLIFGYVRVAAGTLLVSMLMHFCYNLCILLVVQ